MREISDQNIHSHTHGTVGLLARSLYFFDNHLQLAELGICVICESFCNSGTVQSTSSCPKLPPIVANPCRACFKPLNSEILTACHLHFQLKSQMTLRYEQVSVTTFVQRALSKRKAMHEDCRFNLVLVLSLLFRCDDCSPI